MAREEVFIQEVIQGMATRATQADQHIDMESRKNHTIQAKEVVIKVLKEEKTHIPEKEAAAAILKEKEEEAITEGLGNFFIEFNNINF